MMWCLFLIFAIFGTYVRGSEWPVQSLIFNSTGVNVDVIVTMKGEGDRSGNKTEMDCSDTMTWGTEDSSFSGPAHHVRSLGGLLEGTHAVCQLNSVYLLNLSVPCLVKRGVPKPIIISNSLKGGEIFNILHISWIMSEGNLENTIPTGFCTDKQGTKEMTFIQQGDLFTSQYVVDNPKKEKVYCCIALNTTVNSMSYRACDCEVFGRSGHTNIDITQMSLLPASDSYCVNVYWKFKGTVETVKSAGVCCSQNHLFLYKTCNIQQHDSSLSNQTWCGYYGKGNYRLYCYALNTIDDTGYEFIAESDVYSSALDAPTIKYARYLIYTDENATCVVANWIIPRSFYSLKGYSLCCDGYPCAYDTMYGQFLLSSHKSLNMSLMSCLSPDRSDFKMTCTITNTFYPNITVSYADEVTVPVRIWAQSLTVNKSANFETDGRIFFKLKWIANAQLERSLVRDCCESGGKKECVDTGNIIHMTSTDLSIKASCYVEFAGNYTQKSNILQKDLFGNPRVTPANITSKWGQISYTPLFQLHSPVLNFTDIIVTISTGNLKFNITLDEPVQSKLIFSNEEQLKVVVDYKGDKNTYYLQIPVPPNLQTVSVEKIFSQNDVCVNFTLKHINETLDYAVYPLMLTRTEIYCKMMGAHQYLLYDTNATGDRSFELNQNLHHMLCRQTIARRDIISCFVRVHYHDDYGYPVTVGESGRVNVKLACDNPSPPDMAIEYDGYAFNITSGHIQAYYNISWTSEKNCFQWRGTSHFELRITKGDVEVLYTNEYTHRLSFDVDTNYLIKVYAYNIENLYSMSSTMLNVSTAVKNVQLVVINSSCVEISWQHPEILYEEIAHYKVNCSNMATEYSVTDSFMQGCSFKPFTKVQCLVSGHSNDWKTNAGISNTVVTQCDRPEKIEKLEAIEDLVVDSHGNLVEISWSITWKPVNPNCESVQYYNVTLVENGDTKTTVTYNPSLTLRCAYKDEDCSIKVFAVNNEGFSGDLTEEYFVYKVLEKTTTEIDTTSHSILDEITTEEQSDYVEITKETTIDRISEQKTEVLKSTVAVTGGASLSHKDGTPTVSRLAESTQATAAVQSSLAPASSEKPDDGSEKLESTSPTYKLNAAFTLLPFGLTFL